jgi:hypothetical protein
MRTRVVQAHGGRCVRVGGHFFQGDGSFLHVFSCIEVGVGVRMHTRDACSETLLVVLRSGAQAPGTANARGNHGLGAASGESEEEHGIPECIRTHVRLHQCVGDVVQPLLRPHHDSVLHGTLPCDRTSSWVDANLRSGLIALLISHCSCIALKSEIHV